MENTDMSKQLHGPRLSDSELFSACLNTELPGLARVSAAAAHGDMLTACAALAAYLRSMPVPTGFFDIAYEQPENAVTYPGEDEADACRRIMEHTLISVGIPCAFGREHPVDWTANPTENNFMEWPYQLNRHHELKMLAHQYRLTGNNALAECASELLTSWLYQAAAPNADVPGSDTVCWRTIECGIRAGCTWPYVFYVFHDCPAFSDELLVDWIKSYAEHARRLSANHTSGNWLIMEMNGLAHIGMMFPFLAGAEKWKEQSFDSLTEELGAQLYPDGFQYELTTNYHNVFVINYRRLLNMCRATGEAAPESLINGLYPAVGFEHKLMLPDGTLPDLNDGARLRVAKLMKDRQAAFPDHPIVKWLAAGDDLSRPTETSMLLPWSGFAVMRTGWTARDAWALLDGGPFGRGHQHEDKLNVLFYANGKLLLTEGGNYAYDSSAMRSYVLDTVGHNTVRVDGLSQNRCARYRWEPYMIRKRADELTMHCGSEWDYAQSSYYEGYGPDAAVHATHVRRVFFRRSGTPLLIVADRLTADACHTYEGLWHVDSGVIKTGAGTVAFSDLDAVFSQGELSIIFGQETPEWQGFTATGACQGMYRAIPCLSVTLAAQTTRTVAAFAPTTPNGRRLVRVEADSNTASDSVSLFWSDGDTKTFSEQDMMCM